MSVAKFFIQLFYYLLLWPFVSVRVHWTRYDQANYKDPKRIIFGRLLNEKEGDFQRRLSARTEVINDNKLTKDQIKDISESDYSGYINWRKIMKHKKGR